MSVNVLPIIMAGGTGSRLWPLSREQNPKQFIQLGDANHSMLQATIERLEGLNTRTPRLICNESHRFIVAEQLRQMQIDDSDILLEPIGRNTAPAITLAALQAVNDNDDPILLVLAADHLIQEANKFTNCIESAIPFAVAGKLVTFGITPTHAETGYGYIEKGVSVGSEGHQVSRFIEKPNQILAKELVDSKNYLWNSGMFMFRASRYLQEIKKFRPDILDSCKKSLAGGSKDMYFTRLDESAFFDCPADSIDFAVMEKTEDAVVVEFNAGWSDIGSWSALWDVSDKDSSGNVIKGDVIASSSKNNYIHSDSRLIATLGIENLIIVETKDSILIAHKDHSQNVKAIVSHLKDHERTEHVNHREVYRPWGMYDSIDNGHRYQVKRITVKPGAKLSVQMHHHRAEHWIVVSGTAKVTNGEKTYLVTENQSTYIPIGQVHALENPGKIPLELIEIQSGAYLGEDDIVRLEDKYGRIKPTDPAK
ncbi:mannose-1-phosphate guanylyltransferase/mannose-6-phosphate isomerase [Pseudomonas sp. ML2-2023-3]|uniref:mannose-1-phosphate guanylyltransferase/mannose-6-phosphate isomerase n=1 Tax=Pseudomonas sp. ML2-2023-3 TaxID=3122375 RepID=UPI0030D14435